MPSYDIGRSRFFETGFITICSLAQVTLPQSGGVCLGKIFTRRVVGVRVKKLKVSNTALSFGGEEARNPRHLQSEKGEMEAIEIRIDIGIYIINYILVAREMVASSRKQ